MLALGAASALASTAAADEKRPEVIVDVDIGEPVMMAGEEGKAYVEIAITGFDPDDEKRPPVNLALVIDRSGSMHGEKIEKAKEAALAVVDRLGPKDYLSVITYDDDVELLVPSTLVTNPDAIRERIMAISDDGSTALHAGVTAGIQQVREQFSKQRVNRIILLSDGLANVGPSSPAELAQLGVHAGSLGIPVTTIGLGLGYNEDLMTQLALSSDGNHAFAESGADLRAIFEHELGDLLSVVAQDVIIEIEFEPGIRPIRGLNRPLSIKGRKARLKLNQIYGKQTKNVLVEVEVPRSKAGQQRKLADVDVSYRNLATKKTKTVSSELAVEFSSSRSTVETRSNKGVMVSVVEALANERQQKAIALRDKGEIAKARRAMEENSAYLQENSARYQSDKLGSFAGEAAADAADVDDEGDWNRNRKAMKKSAHSRAASQAW